MGAWTTQPSTSPSTAARWSSPGRTRNDWPPCRTASSTPAPTSAGPRPSTTAPSSSTCGARRSPTRTRPAPTSRRRGRCAPAATRSRTRPRRWKRGGTPAAAASSCCRPAPARPSSPSSPSTRSAGPALVVTPTIDLLNQWYGELAVAFDVPIGLLGGGNYEYPAAHRHDLRFRLHPSGTLGQPLRPARLRRVPSPAGADVPGRRRPAASPPTASV